MDHVINLKWETRLKLADIVALNGHKTLIGRALISYQPLVPPARFTSILAVSFFHLEGVRLFRPPRHECSNIVCPWEIVEGP